MCAINFFPLAAFHIYSRDFSCATLTAIACQLYSSFEIAPRFSSRDLPAVKTRGVVWFTSHSGDIERRGCRFYRGYNSETWRFFFWKSPIDLTLHSFFFSFFLWTLNVQTFLSNGLKPEFAPDISPEHSPRSKGYWISCNLWAAPDSKYPSYSSSRRLSERKTVHRIYLRRNIVVQIVT